MKMHGAKEFARDLRTQMDTARTATDYVSSNPVVCEAVLGSASMHLSASLRVVRRVDVGDVRCEHVSSAEKWLQKPCWGRTEAAAVRIVLLDSVVINQPIDIDKSPIYSFFFGRSPILVEPGILKKVSLSMLVK
jgi:hypothetical protein